MKILAIEKDVENADWSNTDDLLKQEALHVFELYLAGTLREIYFTETKNAVLVLETDCKESAQKLIDRFPLVQSGKIRFEVMELRPYTGLQRLIG